MRKLNGALLAAVGLLIVGTGADALAMTTVIDFEGFDHGDVVTGSPISGVTIVANNPHQTFDLGVAFDTNASETSDPDLEAPWSGGNLMGVDLGNILILQENNADCQNGMSTCSDPDDQAGGGSFDFIFDESITSFGFDLIDIDSSEADGLITFMSGTEIVERRIHELISRSLLGDNTANRAGTVFAADFGLESFNKVTISLMGSGGIDNVTYETTAVPEPTTLATLGLGLLGIASYRARRGR